MLFYYWKSVFISSWLLTTKNKSTAGMAIALVIQVLRVDLHVTAADQTGNFLMQCELGWIR